eukprot:COSAG02_NODE_215_length_28614_cov_43.077047_23_plen_561_part_00
MEDGSAPTAGAPAAAAPQVQPFAVRTAAPLGGTPSEPAYDVRKLMWNERRTRNNLGQYSYSGSTKEKVSSLRCNCCQQWFYLDEINRAELCPPGFLAHQRNYSFSCAWCCSAAKPNGSSSGGGGGGGGDGGDGGAKLTDTSWVEQFKLTKPKKYEAIVDAFLNLMATAQPRRKEFKVSEIKDYLLAHWNVLLPGWEQPRELTGDGKPFDIAPYFNKKGEFSQVRKPYWQLTDRRPFQPFKMLLPDESWCLPGLPARDGGDSPQSARVQPEAGSFSAQSTQSDGGAEIQTGHEHAAGTPMGAATAADAHADGEAPRAVDSVDDARSSNVERAYLPDGTGGHELYTYMVSPSGKRSTLHESARSGDYAPAKRSRVAQDQRPHASQEQPLSDAADSLADTCLSKSPSASAVASTATSTQSRSQLRSGQACWTTETAADASRRSPTLDQPMESVDLVPAWLPHGMPPLARQQYEAEHRRLQALPQSPELLVQEHPLSEASLLKQHFHPRNCSSTALKIPGMAIESGCGGLLPVGPTVSKLMPTSTQNVKVERQHTGHGSRRYAL